MADWNDTSRNAQRMGSVPRAGGDVAGRASYDEGLRKHMLSIYNYMTSGILLTGIVALLAFTSGVAETIFTGGILRWIVALSPMAIVFAMSFGANRFSTATLQLMFWGFATLMGLSLSSIFWFTPAARSPRPSSPPRRPLPACRSMATRPSGACPAWAAS